jgi:phosphoribosylformylglycinamidine (FGAM) synthase PurS component
MAHSYLFEIGYKSGVTDPVGRGLKHDIEHLGLGKVKEVASAQLYKIFGQLSTEDRSRIAQDLLCDPILNECREDPKPASKSAGLPKGIHIDIWYKPGVTDVVGDSVQKGIRDLAIQGAKDVRTGMRYHLQGVTRKDVAEKIAVALLVNPLVHESIIHAD